MTSRKTRTSRDLVFTLFADRYSKSKCTPELTEYRKDKSTLPRTRSTLFAFSSCSSFYSHPPRQAGWPSVRDCCPPCQARAYRKVGLSKTPPRCLLASPHMAYTFGQSIPITLLLVGLVSLIFCTRCIPPTTFVSMRKHATSHHICLRPLSTSCMIRRRRE